jgi:hypothetical protein
MIKGIWWAPVMAFVGLAAVVTWTAIDPAFAPASTRAHVTAPRKTTKVAKPTFATALAAPRPRGANVLAQFLNPEGFAWAPPVKYRFSADPSARLGMTENAIGDVTGDGRPDLVALSTNYTDTATRWKVWIYAQTPQGNLAAPYTVSYNEGLSDVPWYYPFSGLNLADYDRDGKLDIAVGYAFGLQVLKSDGKGGFTKTPYRMPSTHKYAVQSMATFDVDRDGDLDVLQFSSSVLEQTLYLNDGQGHFGTGLHIRVPGELERDYEDHKVLDFDGDGYQDLMVLWRGQLSIGLRTRSSSIATWATPAARSARRTWSSRWNRTGRSTASPPAISTATACWKSSSAGHRTSPVPSSSSSAAPQARGRWRKDSRSTTSPTACTPATSMATAATTSSSTTRDGVRFPCTRTATGRTARCGWSRSTAARRTFRARSR